MSPLPEGASYHRFLSFCRFSLPDLTMAPFFFFSSTRLMELMRLRTCACFQVSVRVLFITPPASLASVRACVSGGDGDASVRSSINMSSAVRAARPLALQCRVQSMRSAGARGRERNTEGGGSYSCTDATPSSACTYSNHHSSSSSGSGSEVVAKARTARAN